MKEMLIKWILSALFAVTAEHWTKVLDWVEAAGEKFIEGHLKNEWVRKNIAAYWPNLKPHVVDTLVGLAVGWQQKLGKA